MRSLTAKRRKSPDFVLAFEAGTGDFCDCSLVTIMTTLSGGLRCVFTL